MSKSKKWGIALGISATICIISMINMSLTSGHVGIYVGRLGLCISGGLTLYCGLIFLMYSNIEKNEKDKEDFNAAASFNSLDTLYLKKRSIALQKRIQIVEDRNIVSAYNPQQTHIGAVSVGGVVTGGTYTTGGNYYVAHSEKSGKYRLVYSENDKYRHTISKIQLTGVLS